MPDDNPSNEWENVMGARAAQFASFCLLSIAIAGCVPAVGLGELQKEYPDRKLFRFQSSVAGGSVSYLCAPGPNGTETRKRARAAHAAYEAEIRSYGNTFAKELVGALAAGTHPQTATQTVNRESDAWARQAALKIENGFKCLPVAAPGVGIDG